MEVIKGYEGLYAVTTCGKVWSYKSKRFLKPYIKRGYLTVNLYKDGGYKTKYIHRLVAEAFIPNPDNLPQVNHKNEERNKSYVGNLEWCTASYNINYGNRNSNFSKPVKCLETGIIYPSQHEAARATGIAQTSISYCCNGKFKVGGGLHWEYVKEAV